MFVIFVQIGTPYPTPDYDEIAFILRQNGHAVWVATPNEVGKLVFIDGIDEVASIEIPQVKDSWQSRSPVRRWFSSFRENWIFISHLKRLIIRTHPDIVQVNQAKLPLLWLLPMGINRHTRMIIDWRQIAERQFSGRLAKIRGLFHLMRRRIPSRYIYSQACFLHPAGAERVLGQRWEKWGSVVPLAVSPNFLEADLSNRKTQKNIGSPVRFIYIGSLSRVRRLERILHAAKRIQVERRFDHHFSIDFIGPDKSEGYLKRLSEELGLNGTVKFSPPVPYVDVPEILIRSDVALAYLPETPLDWRYHPTLKVMEYLAIGIPIIATDFEPNRTVVENGRNGLLIENTIDSLVNALNCFISDHNFLRQCAVNAQAMRKGLLWKDVAHMYEQLYLKLAQR